MREEQVNPRIVVRYPASRKLCEEHETTQKDMFKLYSVYSKYFSGLIDFYCLNQVTFTFTIDNWRGAGIDTDIKLYLHWMEKPEGEVGIYLGFPHEINSIISNEIKHTLSHELTHVLIFAYLTSHLNCQIQWVDTWLGKKIELSAECGIPKTYIELLCDTIGITSQYDEIKTFLLKWEEEWDPKNYDKYGEYYFSKNHLWAIEFIKYQSKFINDNLSEEKYIATRRRTWKDILDYFFKSNDAISWMNEVGRLF